MLQISVLSQNDRSAWEILARGYREFYKTITSDAEFDAAWNRVLLANDIRGLGAKLDGQLVGIAHFIFHSSTWASSVCYLQDLFTLPEARGKGVARALIIEVANQARIYGAQRYYWLTQEHNSIARVLYDKVAKYNGFIRYDFAL